MELLIRLLKTLTSTFVVAFDSYLFILKTIKMDWLIAERRLEHLTSNTNVIQWWSLTPTAKLAEPDCQAMLLLV